MNPFSYVQRFEIFLLFSVCVYGDIIRKDDYFKAEFSSFHKGRMLRVLMAFNNIGLELCGVKCIQHISCKTVNYNFEKVKCELTDVDFNNDEADRISYGWFNYGTPPKVNGQWGSWREVTRCSAKCEGGTTNQARDCDSPKPQHGGADCIGKGERTIECNTHPCPVNGQWGSWRNVTQCSATCEGGTTNQTRDCDSPEPQHGGDDCVGNSERTIECNTHPCPAFWTDWSRPGCKIIGTSCKEEQKRNCTTIDGELIAKANCIGDDFRTVDCDKAKCFERVVCNLVSGYGQGKSEEIVSLSLQGRACIEHCYQLKVDSIPTMNGVTTHPTEGCYCEKVMYKIASHSAYKSCFLSTPWDD